VHLNAFGATVNLAVGSFFGGGYYPGWGLPPLPPPPPVVHYDNINVVVRYSRAVYQPFQVSRIVDCGNDATPAWGVWTQTNRATAVRGPQNPAVPRH
jgi:hypothetical protein